MSLRSKTIKELALIYNDLIETNNMTKIKPVKKFATKAAGIQRINKLKSLINPEKLENLEKLETPNIPDAPATTEELEDFEKEFISIHSDEYLTHKKEEGVKIPTDRTIKYRGVSWYPLLKKWRVKVPAMVEDKETGELVRKYINLCFHKNAIEAAKERDQYIDENPELCSKMKKNF